MTILLGDFSAKLRREYIFKPITGNDSLHQDSKINGVRILNYESGSAVGIATAYGLDGPGIESRWEARFSAPVQTGPEVHPASCTMGTGSFPGVRCGRGVTLTPHPLLVPRSKTE